MTGADDTTRLSLGAYALGTLEPADTEQVEAHLAACAACRAELAELSAVVPALASLSAADLAPPPPSADLFGRITAAIDAGAATPGPARPIALVPTTSTSSMPTSSMPSPSISAPPTGPEPSGGRVVPMRRRRPTRWLLAVAASIVVVAGGGTALGVALTSTSGPAATVASGTSGAIRLQVNAFDQGSGTRLELTAQGLPQNERCHLVALAADGTQHDAGTWNASYEGKAEVTESTDVARDDIHQLVLYGNDNAQLVTVTL